MNELFLKLGIGIPTTWCKGWNSNGFNPFKNYNPTNGYKWLSVWPKIDAKLNKF
jgi:hypothetical protein